MSRPRPKLCCIGLAVLVAIGCCETARAQWQPQNSGVEDDLFDAAFTSEDVGVAVGAHNTILRTTDGGQTWKRATARNEKGPDLADVVFADSKNGWAITGIVNNILHTGDGGETWKEITLPGPKGVYGLKGAHHATHAAHGSSYFYMAWGLSGSHLYRTDNAGRDWTELTDKIDLVKLSGNGLAFPDARHGRYVCARKTPHEYYAGTSADGGKTWTEQRLNGNLKGNYLKTQFTGVDRGWLIPQFGDIHVTTDGGKTWTPQRMGHNQTDTLRNLHFLDDNVGHVLCDGSKEVRRTTDGGKTWRALGTIDTKEYLYGLSFPSSNQGYVVGSHGWIGRYVDEGGK